MIIYLKGANFSSNNIGTLDTWIISKSIGSGATYSGPTSVKRDAALSATITITDGYELGSAGVSVTMGGAAVENGVTISGSTIAISISKVTSNVTIIVPTKNTATGDEDAGSGTIYNLTTSNANPAYADTSNHLIDSQVAGQLLAKSNVGTKGILGWDIPQYALVTLTVSSGGNYGMALTDSSDIVIEGFKNSAVATSGNGTYTFSPLLVKNGRLYVSTTKFVSASYVVLSEEELGGYDFSIQMEYTSEVGKYISSSQTAGTEVKLAEMGGVYYMYSTLLPANSTVTLNVKTGGSYGMCLADANNKVLESKPSAQADANGNIVFSKQTVPYRLWVSKTKYNSAKYTMGG